MEFLVDLKGTVTSSGGVTNTGNAAVGDVVLGKTFSSAILTNAAGTLVAGNATVPNDAPIQPPQAFVDNIIAATTILDFDNGLVLTSKGFTHFSEALVADPDGGVGTYGFGYFELARRIGMSPIVVNLSGNALPSAGVNAILANLVTWDSNFPGAGNTINLSGPDMGAPTGQGLNDKQTLIDNGWTVTTN